MVNKNPKRSPKRRNRTRANRKGHLQQQVQQQYSDAVDDYQKGDFASAAEKIDALIKVLPPAVNLLHLRGMIDFGLQKFPSALRYFRQGLALEPNNSVLSELIGTSLLEMGEYQEAINAFRRSLLGNSRNPGALNSLGVALVQHGELAKAEESYRNSLIFRPDDIKTRLNLASLLMKRENFVAAIEVYDALIADDSTLLEAYQALGECHMSSRNWRAALKTANAAMDAGIRDAEIMTLKGFSLGALLKFGDAEAALQEALTLEPGRSSSKIALSILYFYQEKWPQAWAHYEARWTSPPFFNRPFNQPAWSGEDLSGKQLLLWGEQGVGDEIMFASQLTDLLKRGARITFEMEPRLVPLFERSFPVIECVDREDNPPQALQTHPFDFQIATGSLGQFLRTKEADFGDGRAYLKADRHHVNLLKNRYNPTATKKVVGLAWYSSDGRGLTKSIPLDSLKPLAQFTDIQFVDLQYGDTADSRQAFEQATDCQIIHDQAIDQMASIDDFAAQIAAMDLVISISNTTVHIAGALGVPTWIMLPAAPMQRWLFKRSDSPWYASVELFRQRKEDDWPYVIGQVCARLGTL